MIFYAQTTSACTQISTFRDKLYWLSINSNPYDIDLSD